MKTIVKKAHEIISLTFTIEITQYSKDEKLRDKKNGENSSFSQFWTNSLFITIAVLWYFRTEIIAGEVKIKLYRLGRRIVEKQRHCSIQKNEVRVSDDLGLRL